MDDKLNIKEEVAKMHKAFGESVEVNDLRKIMLELKADKWIDKARLFSSLRAYIKRVENCLTLSYQIVAQNELQTKLRRMIVDKLDAEIDAEIRVLADKSKLTYKNKLDIPEEMLKHE